jgi:hypothetical protein
MASNSPCNMWVFREGRSVVPGRKVLAELARALRRLGSPSPALDHIVDALLRAGELECALADAGAPHTPRLAQLTDLVAEQLLQGSRLHHQFASLLDGITAPDTVNLGTAEGFAYYALHPLDFAALADRAPLLGTQAAVIGIRSIGATLSAVVAAALRRRGVRAGRITVRPTGHPFDRQTGFNPAQLRWIASQRAHSAEFLVVDEGPGISGSSFLSVGDALLQAGVERQKITLLCSREVDPNCLTARHAAARWTAFRSRASGATKHVPEAVGAYIGGGEWRRYGYDEESQWPASWTQMERLKFLSDDRGRMFAYVGLGRFGATIASRASVLAEAGFGPELLSVSNGFAEYPWIAGQAMGAADLSAEVLERIADYCAMRTLEFRDPGGQASQLESMVRFNVAEEFGAELAEAVPAMHLERPVLADGRMLPQEWLRSGGRLLKTDGASHGDDHFFPGPTDSAWDLAGAIIEWSMTNDAARYMLQRYRQRAGDNPGPRLDSYLLSYAVFRMAYCSMAAFSMRGSEEEPRLRLAWQHYRTRAERLLHSKLAAAAPAGVRPVPAPVLPQATEGAAG